MADPTPDPAADALAEIRKRAEAAADLNVDLIAEFIGPDTKSIAGWIAASALDVPCLVAAVEVALKQHRRSMFPAGPPGAGNAFGKHYCAGVCWTSVDDQTIYRVWPCQPYQDITRALLGEAASQ